MVGGQWPLKETADVLSAYGVASILRQCERYHFLYVPYFSTISCGSIFKHGCFQ